MKKVTFLMACLVAFACDKKEEPRTQTPDKAQMAAHQTGITWQAPDSWQEEKPSNSMRKAQFSIPKIENDPENASVVITHFPGQGTVGGEDANLIRWYGQFKQPDGSPSSDKALISDKQINNLKVKTVELTGIYLHRPNMMSPNSVEKPDYKMLAAIINSSAGPYFIKFIGPEKTVSKWADSFKQFLQTISE